MYALCSSQVWRETRSGRKGMCRKWFNTLSVEAPALAHRATVINEADGFVMPSKADLKEAKKRRKEERKAKKLAKKRKECTNNDGDDKCASSGEKRQKCSMMSTR